MKKMHLFYVFLNLSSVFYISAQDIQPIKITVEKGIPNVSFSKTTLGLAFWIKEQANGIVLNENTTKLMKLETNNGQNLIKEHNKAVIARETYVKEQAKKGIHMFSSRSKNIIDFDMSNAFRDTIGFKLVLDSRAVPAKNATAIYVEARVSYFISNNNASSQSTIIKSITLANSKVLRFNDRDVSIQQKITSTRGTEKYLGYQARAIDFAVNIEKIERIDNKGNVIALLTQNSPSKNVAFEVSENLANTPINLKITYKPFTAKTLNLNKKISLGL